MSTALDELRATMARLRRECPWDREQTHASLARCLIDECSELLDTIDRQDLPHMREELGDVLIQVIFHALIAEEGGHFGFDDVARDINAKLIRRHPHIYGEHAKPGTAGEVVATWEQIKAAEKKHGPAQAGIFKEQPPRLPALMFAEAIWKQIEKRRWPADGVVDAAQVRALGDQLDEADLGRRLFELAAAARVHGLDPEGALRRHTAQVMEEISARMES